MFNIRHRHTTYYIHKRLISGRDQGFKNLLVRDRRFVGLDLTFSNPVKTDGPVETVQLQT